MSLFRKQIILFEIARYYAFRDHYNKKPANLKCSNVKVKNKDKMLFFGLNLSQLERASYKDIMI